MPFPRPALSQLKLQAAQDIESSLQGSDALLRFSNLNILSIVLANAANLQFGYLDFIALQSNPATATGEYLEMWAALKSVYRIPAQQASNGLISFTGTNDLVIPSGALIQRGDGVQFISTADATVTAGFAVVSAIAIADPTGQTGAFGDTAVNIIMTLGNAIAGITSSGKVTQAFTNGLDIEGDDSLRSRMMIAYQTVPGTGTPAQYVGWAEAVPGVTRAWCVANGMGSGTVLVYTMWDVAEAAFGGFPQGSNGTATDEPRDTHATGDQLAVANAIFPVQGATPLVYSLAPTGLPVNHVISGLSGASAGTKAAIAAALADVYIRTATAVGGTIDVSDLGSAIASVPGTSGFVLTSPNANVASGVGQLPVPGTTTYT